MVIPKFFIEKRSIGVQLCFRGRKIIVTCLLFGWILTSQNMKQVTYFEKGILQRELHVQQMIMYGIIINPHTKDRALKHASILW